MPDPTPPFPQPDGPSRIDRLNAEASAARDTEPRRALELASEALGLARSLGYPQGVAQALRVGGMAHFVLGDYEAALPVLAEGLEAARALGDLQLEASCLNTLGVCHHRLGELDGALEYLGLFLERVRRMGDLRGEAVGLTNVGIIYGDLGDYVSSLAHHRESFERMREAGEFYLAALTNQGVCHRHLGEYQAALECHRQALSAARDRGSRVDEARLLCNVADVLDLLGLPGVQEHLDQALSLSRELGAQLEEAHVLLTSGAVRQRAGDLPSAEGHLRAALVVAEAIGQRHFAAQAHGHLSEVLQAGGDPAGALAHYRRHAELEAELYRGASERRSRALLARLEVEKVRREAEVHRLKNVELAEANAALRTALQALGYDRIKDSRFTREQAPECPLSPRELQVLRLMVEGKNNKQIGEALGVSAATARFHVSSILGKLAVGSRTQAVAVALRHGWLRGE